MHQANCPHCRAALEHDGSLAGQEVVCPSCTGIFRVAGQGNARGGALPQAPAAQAPPVQPTNPLPVIDTRARRAPAAPQPTVSEETGPPDESGGSRALVYGLTGLVLFLLGLIGAVVGGRYVRDRMDQAPAVSEPTVEQWVEQLAHGTDKVARRQAAEALVASGPDAVAAGLDAIAEARDDGNVFNISPPAVQALAELGPPAVGPLSQALTSDKLNVRAGAAFVLREMGPQCQEAVEPLAKAAADPNPRVRWYALDALAAIGPGAAPAVDALIPLAEHEERLTRRRAIAALGRIGPKAKAAVPAITKVEQAEPDNSIRQAAELALRQINLEAIVEESLKEASDEVKQLVKRLQDKSPYESSAAARALGKMGRDAAEAIPALAQALQRAEAPDDKWVREAAAEALGAMGRDARPFAASLVAATQDKEPEVRTAAQRALEKVEGRK